MDKKLLLAIQYQCNRAGITIPWDGVGNLMGEKITGGAVIQHLAKLRVRMVAFNLSVPPPLRRGGGGGGGSSRASTSAKPSQTKTKATSPPKKSNVQAKSVATKSAAKSKKAGKKASSTSDESDDEEDWKDEDSDGNYGEPSAKRAKSNTKGPMRRVIKQEESEDEAEGSTQAPKRKHKRSTPSDRGQSPDETTDINGVPVYNDSDDGNDIEGEIVGAGETWLALEDDHTSQHSAGKETSLVKKSLVVSLPTTRNKTGVAGNIKQEDADGMSEDENADEFEDSGDEVENDVDESQGLSAEEIEEAFTTPHSHPGAFNHGVAANGVDLVPAVGHYNGANNNSYHPGQPTTTFNGGFQGHQSFPDTYTGDFTNQPSYHVSDGTVDDDFTYHHTMQQPGAFDPTNDPHSEMALMPYTNDGQNLAPFSNNGNIHGLPYPIQTSWPNSSSGHGILGGSAYSPNTSVNQTPAGPSAGADFGNGYFNGTSQFDIGSFDEGGFDFSAHDDGAEMLFNAGNYDGNFIDGGGFGGDFYGC